MIERDARRAIAYNAVASPKLKSVNLNKLEHKPTSYGVAIKWLLFVRRMKYADFAKRYNGTTAQNANHIINRMKKECFSAEDIEKVCKLLRVEPEYFYALSEKIEEISDGEIS